MLTPAQKYQDWHLCLGPENTTLPHCPCHLPYICYLTGSTQGQ